MVAQNYKSIVCKKEKKARVWSFKPSGDKREQVQREKDHLDLLRGGKEKRERTVAQEEGITEVKKVPESHSVAVSDINQWWAEKDKTLPGVKKQNILTGTKTDKERRNTLVIYVLSK